MDPTTRPGEMARYREIAKDAEESRFEMMTAISDVRVSTARMEEWMRAHDARDNERFASLEERMGNVTSGVNNAGEFRTRIDGIKTGVLFVLGAIGIAITALWAAVTFWWDHK